MSKPISVIDLFAGPGGLGEGFSSYVNRRGISPFRTAISIEKEESAHATLQLRAFYRQFARGQAPHEYYDFLRGKLGRSPEEELYRLSRFKSEVAAARAEARCLTLGEHDDEINRALDGALRRGEDSILIGGPPCQAYSIVGRSRRMGEPDYVPENDGRNFLYQQYLRVIARCRPAAFIMENVKGMLSAQVDGSRVFERILEDLQHPWADARRRGPAYKIFSLTAPRADAEAGAVAPSDYIVRMEQFGVPQARHRVLLFGVREDIAANWHDGLVLSPEEAPTVRDVIGNLPALRSGLSKGEDSKQSWFDAIAGLRSGLAEIKDFGGRELADAVRGSIKAAEATPSSRGFNFSPERLSGSVFGRKQASMRSWFEDPAANALLCNHESRGHMAGDLRRYLFCATWAQIAEEGRLGSPFPRPADYPASLVPDHDNFHTGHFADRFRVQLADRFATTVTSHISKDGHYFIHYDPAQCRSLTVREAARIQTFPDNYFFLGNRTQQYVQVGNAVPPFLARQVAELVAKLLKVE